MEPERLPNVVDVALPVGHRRASGGTDDSHRGDVVGTLYHGDLWGCPLVYSTTIAPFQRATWRASLSRADTLCTNELCTGSGTACHVTMCPFAFTVDDSHIHTPSAHKSVSW